MTVGFWTQVRPLLTWDYLVELALAGVCHWLLHYWFGSADLVWFVGETAEYWAAFTGVLLAASLAIWAAFIAIIVTDFGEYLHHEGSLRVYSTAFLTACAIFFLTTTVLIITKPIGLPWLRHSALFLLLYSGVNALTIVKNSSELVFLHATFRQELKKEMLAMQAEAAPPVPTKAPTKKNGKAGPK